MTTPTAKTFRSNVNACLERGNTDDLGRTTSEAFDYLCKSFTEKEGVEAFIDFLMVCFTYPGQASLFAGLEHGIRACTVVRVLRDVIEGWSAIAVNTTLTPVSLYIQGVIRERIAALESLAPKQQLPPLQPSGSVLALRKQAAVPGQTVGYGSSGPALSGYSAVPPMFGGYSSSGPALSGYGGVPPMFSGYGLPGPAVGGYGLPGPAVGGYGLPGPAVGVAVGPAVVGYGSQGLIGYGSPGPALGGYGGGSEKLDELERVAADAQKAVEAAKEAAAQHAQYALVQKQAHATAAFSQDVESRVVAITAASEERLRNFVTSFMEERDVDISTLKRKNAESVLETAKLVTAVDDNARRTVTLTSAVSENSRETARITATVDDNARMVQELRESHSQTGSSMERLQEMLLQNAQTVGVLAADLKAVKARTPASTVKRLSATEKRRIAAAKKLLERHSAQEVEGDAAPSEANQMIADAEVPDEDRHLDITVVKKAKHGT